MMNINTLIANFFLIGGLTLYLWKKNILSDISEQTFVSCSIALIFVTAVGQINVSGLTPLLAGNIILIIPLILGLLVYTQFIKKYIFLMKWSMGIVIGVGLGILIRTGIETNIMKNLSSSILPLTGVGTGTLLNNLLMIIAVLSTIVYFLFTIPRTGTFGKVQRTGRIFMMAYFGAQFGMFIMTRLSALIVVLNMILQNFGIIS